jgi:hypothetical protein
MYVNMNTQEIYIFYIIYEMRFKNKTYGLNFLIARLFQIGLKIGLQLEKDFFTFFAFSEILLNCKTK